MPKTPEAWHKWITEKLQDRCDFNILLKDLKRHTTVLRDNPNTIFLTKKLSIDLSAEEYLALEVFFKTYPAISIESLALTVFHIALGAYGHGNDTLVAFLESNNKDTNSSNYKILPIGINHSDFNSASCLEFLKEIQNMVEAKKSFIEKDRLEGRGLFDAGLMVRQDEVLGDKSNFPLIASIRNNEQECILKWTLCFATELFDASIIEGFLKVIKQTLLHILKEPTQEVQTIDFLPSEQKNLLLAWNNTDGEFAENVRLEELFEHAVKKTPDLEAVIFEDVSLTYSDLNSKVAQIAYYLTGSAIQIKSSDIIALYLDRDEKVVPSMLGIWKAGAAFLPIALDYPSERIQFILNDSKAKYVLTSQKHFRNLKNILNSSREQPSILVVETILDTPVVGAGNTSAKLISNPMLHSSDIAYITYTSGTTGVPKGVAKIHRSVVNSITDLSDQYAMRTSGVEKVALFSAYVFEPFIRQMLIALINSQTLIIVPDSIRMDIVNFPKFLQQHRITYLNGTGSLLQHFDFTNAKDLRRILLVGEELTQTRLTQLRKTFDGEIINEYAFTETAFVTAIKRFLPGEGNRIDRSIGKPLRNVKCYVLNNKLKQVPIGSIGELYIGGEGCAQGYINRPELTQERFLSNPYQTIDEKMLGKNVKIYKTGDLARILPIGELEYLGREDFQLKLNGIRVEPGEIEAQTMRYPGVSQCIIIPKSKPNGEFFLIGYFTAVDNISIPEEDLVLFLQKYLISVMVPARMIQLEVMPINVNGKIDRTKLPEVELFSIPIMESQEAHLLDHDITYDEGESSVDKLQHIIQTVRNLWGDILNISPDKIALTDDFFRLGGQSISCTLFIARLRKALGLRLNIRDLFKLRTLQNITKYLDTQEVKDISNYKEDMIDSSQVITFRANGVQQGLLYHALRHNTIDDAYIIQAVYQYNCEICPKLLKKAWEQIFFKYPALNLRFKWENEPLQIIDFTSRSIIWHFEDLTEEQDILAQEDRIRAIQKSDRASHYNVEEGPLFRLYLLKQSKNKFTLIFSGHHLILDGWSIPLLYDDVHRTYLNLMDGQPILLERDNAYLVAQRYLKEHANDFVDYWTEQINLIGERCDFSGLLNAQSRYKIDILTYNQVIKHKEEKKYLGKKLTADLHDICQQHSLTLHSILQFAWHKTLQVIGGGESTVVGTIVSGRNLPIDGIEKSVGLFINTLPLVVNHKIQNEKTIYEALIEIQTLVNTMNDYSILEISKIQNVHMKRSLFDTLFVLENYPQVLEEKEAAAHMSRLKFKHLYDVDKVDHPLAVVLREIEGELVISIWYAGEVFEDIGINTLLDTFEVILTQVSSNISILVKELEFCSQKTLTVFDKWNLTEASFPEERTLSELFTSIAHKWPDSIAIVYGDKKVNYKEVEDKSNQLGHYLKEEFGIKANDLITLVMDKSEQMILSILGVWKSGAGYVPIDPKFPEERIQFMIKDTQAKVVITNEVYVKKLSKVLEGTKVIGIEGLNIDEKPRTVPETQTTSRDLAYAIYTSGTTGQPKAVLVEHGNLKSFMDALSNTFFFSHDGFREGILFLSNYVFDFSLEQIVLSILSGRILVIPSSVIEMYTNEFYEYLNQHYVTYLSGTPTQIQQFEFSRLKYVHTVLVAGEAFQAHHFQKIRKSYRGHLYCAYGTTETTVYNTIKYFPIEAEYENNLGFSLSNTDLIILDEEKRPTFKGAIGELYVAGDCVARGYLNQPSLTKERFLKNFLYKDRTFHCLYKTGDLVRIRPDGSVSYIGRNDSQIKVNGIRIELGEIENVLARFPSIKECAVVGQPKEEHHTQYLVAYFVTNGDISIDTNHVLTFLKKKLPSTMIPHYLVQVLERLPLTVNGKLDVKSLPKISTMETNLVYVSPRTRLEAEICDIWRDQISNPEMGIDDNFFYNGGDSIKAMLLASTLQRKLGKCISVKNIFDFPTVRTFFDYITKEINTGIDFDNARKNTHRIIKKKEKIHSIKLLPIQSWFFSLNLPKKEFWNQFFTIKTPFLELGRLKTAIKQLVEYHDAFHLKFVKDSKSSNYFHQRLDYVYDDLEILSFDISTVSEKELELKLNNLQATLNLEKGYLWRFVHLHGYSDKSDRVWFAMHHLIVDTVSWQIIARDLEILYSGGSLGAKPDNYLEWTHYISKYKVSLKEKALWDRLAMEVKHTPSCLQSFVDYTARSHTSSKLSKQETIALLKECNFLYDTQIMDLLLAALSLTLSKITGQVTTYITLESHGRPILEEGPEIKDTVGWFTAMYPFGLTKGTTIAETILSVKSNRQAIPNHGIGYGALKGIYGSQSAPIPLISFNYLGQLSPLAHDRSAIKRWQIDPESSGIAMAPDNRSANHSILDITLYCQLGELIVNFDGYLNKELAQRLTETFLDFLKDIITLTLSDGDKNEEMNERKTDRPNSSKRQEIEFEPYIWMNQHQSGPTLFLFPPGEGGAESYLNNIGKYLKNKRLVVFNNRHLYSPMDSFEEIADYYLKHLYSIQSSGPYHLLGWSFGGVLALQLALLLANKGERIENLIIIDSYFDVRYASQKINYPNKEDILDPINYYYYPNKKACKVLEKNVGKLIFFKAGKVNDVYTNIEQRTIFEYYNTTHCHHLERLISKKYIDVKTMENDNHHSWVHNLDQILDIVRTIAASLEDSPINIK